MSRIETLLNEKNLRSGERWYPHAVTHFKAALKLDNTVPNCGELRSNLAYSLQYIEFLELEMEELNLSSVLFTLMCKTYVITGMSVLEGLFTNQIKRSMEKNFL